jgi:hypothetical protein
MCTKKLLKKNPNILLITKVARFTRHILTKQHSFPSLYDPPTKRSRVPIKAVFSDCKHTGQHNTLPEGQTCLHLVQALDEQLHTLLRHHSLIAQPRHLKRER